jgi:two-component system, NtrC family, response regulator AtoC
MDILFVEDHDESRAVISKILASGGHRVTAAANIEEALSFLSSFRFDVLLSDISLPDGSGLELVAAAKKKQPLRKAVALTGRMQPELREAGLRAGFDEYLTKPIDFYDLRSLLSRVG